MTTLSNVKLAEIKEVQKKHLRGKPLYVGVYEDPISLLKTEVEIGLRMEPPELYKIGESYDVTTESKYGSERIVAVSAVGGASIPVAPFGSVPIGGATKPVRTYGKEFPVPTLHGDRSIIRQNSLRHATELWTSIQPILPSDNKVPSKIALAKAAEAVIELARTFEEYSAGDVERRAAEAVAAESLAKDSA